jgi:hypothetical protein
MIAQGNLLVFQEIAPMVARMIDLYRGVDEPTEEMLEQVKGSLRAGPPEEQGQDMLRTALDAYHRAILSKTRAERAQHVLHGNACIGLHEQTRLQPFILGSLNAPVRRILRQVTAKRLPSLLQSTFEGLMRPMADRAAQIWREIATREMMTLHLPSRELHLGRPLPGSAKGTLYPDELEILTNDALAQMLDRVASRRKVRPADGTHDWSDLDQRMGYIAELFRGYQCDGSLHAPPFNADQEAVLMAGRTPEGRL